MALVIMLLGGLFGMLFGIASYVMGFGLLTSVLIYGAAAHALSIWLFWRFEAGEQPEIRLRLTEEEIRADLQALREADERNRALEASDGSSLFRLLRMTADRDRSRATARAARRIAL